MPSSMTIRDKIEKDPRVSTVSLDSDGIWVFFLRGYTNPFGGSHAIHGTSWRVVASEMEHITVCNCGDCR